MVKRKKRSAKPDPFGEFMGLAGDAVIRLGDWARGLVDAIDNRLVDLQGLVDAIDDRIVLLHERIVTLEKGETPHLQRLHDRIEKLGNASPNFQRLHERIDSLEQSHAKHRRDLAEMRRDVQDPKEKGAAAATPHGLEAAELFPRTLACKCGEIPMFHRNAVPFVWCGNDACEMFRACVFCRGISESEGIQAWNEFVASNFDLAQLENPLPCLCGAIPEVSPKDPDLEGDAWAKVHCDNERCIAKPSVRHQPELPDGYGNANLKRNAVFRWNQWIQGEYRDPS